MQVSSLARGLVSLSPARSRRCGDDVDFNSLPVKHFVKNSQTNTVEVKAIVFAGSCCGSNKPVKSVDTQMLARQLLSYLTSLTRLWAVLGQIKSDFDG